MKKTVKYSKSYSNLLSLKKDLYQKNKLYLNEIYKVNNIYTKQPARKKCKNCNKSITKKLFISHKVDYSLCNNCGHLNGVYLENKKFLSKIYNDNDGKNYYPNYSSDFAKRINVIYKPKLKFLKKIIKEKITITEVGSGAGQLLKACEDLNIKAEGYETNKKLIELGLKNLKSNKLLYSDLDSIYENIIKSKSNTLVLISVLEHLEDPLKMIKAFKKSKLKYLYICVPLFSFSVLLENVFQKIYPRVLGGAHTHLYSEKSLNHLAKSNKLKIIGEWWFGADIPDLFRMLINSSNYNDQEYEKILHKVFASTCDDLQKVIDKKKFCAQVHMVLKKN